MDFSHLSRLFMPRHIAIIGGGVWGEHVVRNCRALGFQGEIWPVHPSTKALAGIPAYANLADLPAAPDAAYICVNRHASIEAVAALAWRGAGGAVCLAAGFLEAEKEEAHARNLQQMLVAAAGTMPLIGPNCYGFINYLDGVGLWPDQQGAEVRASGVAVLSQSSNMVINLSMVDSGLPLSHLFTVGNQAQLDMAEIALGLIDDPRVRALGLHIEGMKSVRNLERLAQTAQLARKPIIALKVGRSEAAQAATASHTASLAGNHAVASALFQRLGIAQVESLPEFVEALKLAYVTGPVAANTIASMSCSGGEASLIADLAQIHGVDFTPLSASVSTALRSILGSMVPLANPLDYHTYIWRNEDKLTQVFTAMAKGEQALNLVILDYPAESRCDDIDWTIVEKAIVRAKTKTGAFFGVVATLHDNMRAQHAQSLMDQGIVAFAGLSEALRSVALLSKAELAQGNPVLLGEQPAITRRLEEAQAKQRLQTAGLAVPVSRRVVGVEAACAAAVDVGFPVVLKGEGFTHKTEAGAVVLNLQSPSEVRQAAEAIPSEYFLIEEMISPVLLELIVGVRRDTMQAYQLTIGAGGVFAEILQDVQTLLIPASRPMLERALDSLRIAPLLRGYRGQKAVNRQALLDAIDALQNFAIAHCGKIETLEINPLLLGEDFAVAADALIIGDFT